MEGQLSSKTKLSAGILAYRHARYASRFCSSTPADRSGETRTTERGLSRRARSIRRKIRSRQRAANSPRSLARLHPSAHCSRLARSGSAAASA
jgi:hypothetical protein